MFRTFCCTFTPNNTSPDGSITKALEGLTSLCAELTENYGIKDLFTDIMEKWFGRWSGLVTSILLSLSVVAAILVTCGCYCIPYLGGLFQRLRETTLTRIVYQQIESDDVEELQEDNGDTDADDV